MVFFLLFIDSSTGASNFQLVFLVEQQLEHDTVEHAS